MWSFGDSDKTKRGSAPGGLCEPLPPGNGSDLPPTARRWTHSLTPAGVQSRLSRALFAALLAGAIGPVVAWLYTYTTLYPAPSPAELVLAYLFNFMAVFLAVVAVAGQRPWAKGVTAAKKFGSYELIRKLGEGGMGEVWEAIHRRLGRAAAIKVIKAQYLSTGRDQGAAARRRFEREARATANLQSQHTVQVFDYGTTEDGTFFYVMEMLRGFGLDELVEKCGPLPEARAIHLLKQAAESLWDAHNAGLIHRDIKPANIHVSQYGHTPDMVKVLDFGLVKSTGDLLAGETQLTQAGATTGTPAYMAPEVALGNKTVDGRADIYSLGCVAFFLLTGQQVFEEDNPIKMALAHVGENPEAPSARTDQPISAGLDQLILACLAKDPGDRPQSAAELIERLEGLETDAFVIPETGSLLPRPTFVAPAS